VKRIPIVPTLLVLMAMGVMLGLGVWQWNKRIWKADLVAGYRAAQQDMTIRRWPDGDATPRSYSHVVVRCADVGPVSAKSGRNDKDEAGIAQIADCHTAGGLTARIVLGWSRNPQPVTWHGGEVTGVFLAQPQGKFDIVADPPLAGLEPNAKPDPRDIPNNHLAYAVQWFLFAGVALVIYALALRKRMRGG